MRTLKIIGWVIGATIGATLITLLSFTTICGRAQKGFVPVNEPQTPEKESLQESIKGYVRAEETTYLTLPEWYLVFNPQEYARFIEKNDPSRFPYFASVGQAWKGYCQVYGITKRNYPFNADAHLVEAVIVASFTFENLIKGAYEKSAGRVAEAFDFGLRTQEDDFAAQVAYEYGAFIPNLPWYEFPFGEKLGALWRETDLIGFDLVRKWERKLFLSLEYGVKEIYARAIKAGTKSVLGSAATEVYATVTHTPRSVFQDERVRLVSDLGENSYIVALPHYQGFTDIAPFLAKAGIKFADIAGNDEILLTALAPSDWAYDLPVGTELFSMRSLVSEDKRRIAVQAPVKDLSQIILEMNTKGVELEHVYDY